MPHVHEPDCSHELPLRRRVFRFVLFSVIVIFGVQLVEGLVIYWRMSPSAKAAHQASAACGDFAAWLEAGSGSDGAAVGSLERAARSADAAAARKPARWRPLAAALRDAGGYAHEHETGAAGPRLVSPAEQAVSGAIATCSPIVRQDLARFDPVAGAKTPARS